MRSVCRRFCIAWLCGMSLTGFAMAQQKQDDQSAKADAEKKSAAAKAAAAEIEKLETARAALATQRNAALAAQRKVEAATAEAAQNEAKLRGAAAAADQQRMTALAQARAEVEKSLADLRAAEAAGGANNEKAIAELQQRRTQALEKYRALLAQVPAVAPAPAVAAAPGTLRAAVLAAQPVLNVQVVGDANNAMQREMITRLRPILNVELGFVNRVSHPNKQQRKAIAAAGEVSLQTAAQEYAIWQQSGQRGRVVVVNGRATRAVETPKPRQMIQDGVAKAVKEHLPAEAAALYVEQSNQRSEYRKQLTIENLVSFLDDKLVLSSAQRSAISKALTAAWDENWIPQLQLMSNGTQFLPSIPDQCVVPHLRDSQRTVWQAIPNRNNQVIFDDLQIQTGVTFDDSPDGEADQ
jgi:hypothetical protein